MKKNATGAASYRERRDHEQRFDNNKYNTPKRFSRGERPPKGNNGSSDGNGKKEQTESMNKEQQHAQPYYFIPYQPPKMQPTMMPQPAFFGKHVAQQPVTIPINTHNGHHLQTTFQYPQPMTQQQQQ